MANTTSSWNREIVKKCTNIPANLLTEMVLLRRDDSVFESNSRISNPALAHTRPQPCDQIVGAAR
jgi:hypothetical protein